MSKTDTPKSVTMQKLKDLCYTIAYQHGWHEERISVERALVLLHSEVSEACEAARRGNMHNVKEELADVLIRLLDSVTAMEIECTIPANPTFEEVVLAKCEKNKNREHRHGGKRFFGEARPAPGPGRFLLAREEPT